MFKGRISIVSLSIFIFSFSIASAGDVLFETTLPWYYSWSTIHWGSGSLTRTNEVAIRYIPTANQDVCTIKPGLFKSGNPTDSVVLTVREGGNGNPTSGTIIATSTVPASQMALPPVIGNQSSYTSFKLSSCLHLTGGTRYFFNFARSQLPNMNTPDLTNWYALQISNLISYTQTAVSVYVPVNGFWQETTGYEPALRLEGPDTKEPVIIMPGILGSRLSRSSDGEEVWLNELKMIDLLHPEDNYLDDLKLSNTGGEIIDINSGSIVSAVFGLNQYGNLIQKFKDKGYVLGRDLFVVPYDWRLDITKSSLDLDSVISQAIANSPTGKVNIITHSMGGLLVKDYLMRNGDAKVNKLIFAGTPHLGAPKAFNALNWGDDFDIKLIGLGLNRNKAKEIMQNMPAAYQLLPSQEYLTEAGPYVKDNNGTSLDYGETSQLMATSNLLSDHRNLDLLTRADQFHQSHDNWLPQSAHVYNLIGCLDPDTIGSFKVGENGSVDINSVDGDGTVPLVSANHIPGKNYFVAYPVTKINHTGLISNDMTIGLMYNLIASNSDPTLPLGIYTSSNCRDQLTTQQASELKRLRFSTHSPVNLHVYDSQGHHTGLTSDGNFETSIPESNFFQVGDNTFISVPGSASYTVKIDAYATGSFDFKVKELDGNDIQNAAIYADVPIKNPTLKADLQFTSLNNLATLNVDEEGDGIDDIGYSLDGKKTFYHDHEPPVITLNSDPIITLNVHDIYTEQGAEVVDDYDSGLSATITGEVNTDILGSYVVHYNAVDSSGNQAIEITRTIKVIDTEKPIIVLNGSNPATILVHDAYNEEGATVNDNYDNNLVPTITGTVDVDKIGTYALHYNVADSSGNVADQVDRTVNVVDTQKPAINLVGANPQVIEVYNPYVELGATVSDNSDTDIIPVIDSLNVNKDLVGSYTVLYNAADSSGNQADQAKRVIEVVDTTPPDLNLISPVPGEYERSAVIPVSFTITDNYTLVNTKVDFDGISWTSPNIDLFYYPLGPHTFSVSGQDEAGNTTLRQAELHCIATYDSTISDINRAYGLGWVASAKERDAYIRKIGQALKIEARIIKVMEKLPDGTKREKRIERLEKRLDKLLATAFLKQLEKDYTKGNVNEQAYRLIREDIMWLLNN